MDSGRILLALQERDKWRDRRTRLEDRLHTVQARKRFLQRELDAVRRKVARLEEVAAGLKDGRVPWEHAYGTHDHVRR